MHVLMYAPTAKGGHPLYVQEVLNALVVEADAATTIELLTAKDLERDRITENYTISRILPRLVDRSKFKNSFYWLFSRSFHYPLTDFLTFKHLFRIKKKRVLHLQEHNLLSSLALICMAKIICRARVVLTLHNITPHQYPSLLPRQFVDFILRRIYRNCDALIVHTQKLKLDVISFCPELEAQSVHVAAHGIWSIFGKPSGRPPVGNFERQPYKKNILFFGTIRRNKGLGTLLEALGKLDASYRLTVAGLPIEMKYYESEVIPVVDKMIALGREINMQVRYIPDHEVKKFFDDSSLIVLPYKDFASQSGVLLNAVAFSLPIITSAEGALGETVEEYGIGIVLQELDADSLANGIRDFFDRPQEKYHRNFLEAQAQLSWDVHAKSLLKAYRAE
jgi:glycosyltransferase involved in cell wall biosynthesis